MVRTFDPFPRQTSAEQCEVADEAQRTECALATVTAIAGAARAIVIACTGGDRGC